MAARYFLSLRWHGLPRHSYGKQRLVKDLFPGQDYPYCDGAITFSPGRNTKKYSAHHARQIARFFSRSMTAFKAAGPRSRKLAAEQHIPAVFFVNTRVLDNMYAPWTTQYLFSAL